MTAPSKRLILPVLGLTPVPPSPAKMAPCVVIPPSPAKRAIFAPAPPTPVKSVDPGTPAVHNGPSLPLPTENPSDEPPILPKPQVPLLEQVDASQKSANPVKLKSWQPSHCARLTDIWRRHFFFIDASVMGSGKTHILCWLAKECNFTYIVVVCAAAGETTWQRVGAQYGLNIVVITSYESLRSVKGAQPKHGLLTRIDTETGAVFTPTPQFQAAVEYGCLLVGDEFQRVKNKNDQQAAFKALSQYIHTRRGNSRVALLSGTPFDKRDHVINLLQTLGIIRNHRLYVYHKEEARLELLGAQELLDYCNKISTTRTAAVIAKEKGWTQRTVHEVCYQLYVGVIQDEVQSTMPIPDIPVDIDVHNAYCNLSEVNAVGARKWIGALHSAARYDPGTGGADLKEANWGAITTALLGIETCDTEIFIRMAMTDLETDPNVKVVLAFNYNTPILMAAEALKKYKPLLLTGKLDKRKRHPLVIDKFQEDNNNHRLIIGNMACMWNSINLDDTTGRHPRKAYGSPNYHVERMHQFTRRFHRATTLSEPHVAFVYAKCGRIVTSILNALSRKTDIMKATLKAQVEQGMLFPGEYVKWTEPDAIVNGVSAEVVISSEDAEIIASNMADGDEPLPPLPEIPGLPLPVENGTPPAPGGPRSRSPSPTRGFRETNIVLAPTVKGANPFA